MSMVLVGVSGGVDSAAAALLLKEAGWEVRGAWLRMTPGQQEGPARSVCEALKIPLEILELSDPFEEEVLKRVAADYRAGRTPNPCVLCNPAVKLAGLVSRAEALGADRIATGHYARLEGTARGVLLERGADLTKDQSYFLARVGQEVLGKLILPLGGMKKQEIRALVRAAGLDVADAPESQETCFAGDDGLGDFLEERCGLTPREGPVVLEDGREIGQHRGLHRFTVGQRRGLGIAWRHPLYVVRLEPDEDRLVVGQRDALAAGGLEATDPVWATTGIPAPGTELQVKIRYRSPAADCTLDVADSHGFRISFAETLTAVTPGQLAALYDGEQVVGAGWIRGAR